MTTFSEEMGIVKARDVLQVDDMDKPLRTAIWNVVYPGFAALGHGVRVAAEKLATEILNSPVDSVMTHYQGPLDWLRDEFHQSPWNVVYDIVKWMAEEKLINTADADAAFSRFGSGYRFVGDRIAPITSSLERDEIERAIEAAHPFPGVQKHLAAAIAKLAEKPQPDYRNSIKESIQAVEAIVSLVAGMKPAGVSDPLAVLKKELALHGAFAAGIEKLYGWTSQDGGIRHAFSDEKEVGHAEAKFMLVACSAFVNFVIEKAAELGKLPR